MKQFAATRYEAEIAYGETVEAETEEEAMRICDENDWEFEGEIHFTIPADEVSIHDIEAFVASLNEGKAH
jgi:hypothetical protein